MGRMCWWAAAIFVLIATRGTAWAQNAVSFELPETMTQMVVSPGSGVVASIESGKSGVVLYPKISSEGSFAGASMAPVIGRPVAMVHKPLKKGGMFIVADDQRTIYLLDDKSGKRLGMVKVEKDIFDIAAALSADSNYVFYTVAGANHGPATNFLGRVDIDARKDAGLFETPQGFHGDAYNVETDAEGRTIYLARPHTSPTGIYALRWENLNENRLTKAYDDHSSANGYVPLPEGLGTAINREVRSASLRSKTRQLPANIAGAMRDKPIAFCMEPGGKQIMAVSLNTGKLIATVDLPPLKRGQKANGKLQRRFKKTAVVDEVNQNLVVQNWQIGAIIPLSLFSLPAEPLMAVRVDGSTELSADEAWTARILTLDEGLTVTLAAAPAGMKLDKGKLSWTPPSENIGSAKATLEISAGEVKTSQQIELVVRQRGLKLPFVTGHFAATPDGKKLVVIEANNAMQRPDDQNQTSRMAVIDIATGRVILELQLDVRVFSMDASNDSVFFAANRVDAVYSLAFDNPGNVNKTFTDGGVGALKVAGNRLYALLERRGTNPGIARFALPKMEPIEINETLNASAMHNEQFLGLPEDVRSGWRQGEAVWSRDFSKVNLLLDAPTIPTLHLNFSGPAMHQAKVARWGTIVDFGEIRRLGGQVIAQTNEVMGGTTLLDLPAAVMLRAQNSYDQEQRMQMLQAELVVVNLVTGKDEKILLLKEPSVQGRFNPQDARFDRRPVIVSQPGKIIAVVGDRAFIVPTSKLKVDRLTEPLYFEGEQSSIMVSGTAPARVTYKVKGGKAPLKFSLTQDAPGIVIDPATGTLIIDPKMISGEKLAPLMDSFMRFNPDLANAARSGANVPDIREVAGRQIQLAQMWSGAKVTGVPIALRLGVRVRDANQQEAVLDHAILVDVPAEIVQKQLIDRIAGMRKQIEGNQAAAIAPGRPASGGDDAAALRKRVAELELENAKLKAQVEVLKEIRQTSPTGRTN